MTTASAPCLKHPDWRPLYRATIRETNTGLLQQRVLEAEEAVLAREREVHYGNASQQEEKEALEDALYVLRAFRNAWQNHDTA